MDGGGDDRRGVGAGIAVVHRDGVPLVFHPDPGDRFESSGQFGGRTLELWHGLGRGLVAVVAAVRARHLEAVAARVPQSGDADPITDVIEAASGQDRDGIERGERCQRLLGAGHQGGRFRIVDDPRQGPVEVEEDRRPTGGDGATDLAE